MQALTKKDIENIPYLKICCNAALEDSVATGYPMTIMRWENHGRFAHLKDKLVTLYISSHCESSLIQRSGPIKRIEFRRFRKSLDHLNLADGDLVMIEHTHPLSEYSKTGYLILVNGKLLNVFRGRGFAALQLRVAEADPRFRALRRIPPYILAKIYEFLCPNIGRELGLYNLDLEAEYSRTDAWDSWTSGIH